MRSTRIAALFLAGVVSGVLTPAGTAVAEQAGHAVVDVNRPRSPFDCELPIGEQWYGSRQRCLAYLCEGQNVYNEYIFDKDNRRRRNPCYGQSPTQFPDE